MSSERRHDFHIFLQSLPFRAYCRVMNSGPVVESAVMGRTAVAVCVAFFQLPAIIFLTGSSGSPTINDVSGNPVVPLLWSICFVLSAFMMCAVYLLKSETDKTLAELAVLALVVVAMTVYLTAYLEVSPSTDERAAGLAIIGSMVVNLVGRACLLLRQLAHVRQVAKSLR